MNFRIKTNHENPPRNTCIFEEYFGENFNQNMAPDRIYIPVYWTNYYIEKHYGQDDMSELQDYLDSLDRSKKYFTVVQWDDGILQDISGLDIISYSSGGVGGYPIPLNSSYIELRNSDKKFKIGFIGAIVGRHPIREWMLKTIDQSPTCYIFENRTSYHLYLDIMSKTTFSLCPRGYGKTSFRIYESLMCGSIPVYIYDDPWIPFGDVLNFEKYGILCHYSEIQNLEQKLDNISQEEIDKMVENGRYIFDKYYTHKGIMNNIIERLKIEKLH